MPALRAASNGNMRAGGQSVRRRAWAARRISGKGSLYNAGGEITGTRNGLAISGDCLSATTLLGTTARFYATGTDTLIYWLTPLVGLMPLLISGPLRRLGQDTLGDVMVAKLGDERLPIYPVAQMVAPAR